MKKTEQTKKKKEKIHVHCLLVLQGQSVRENVYERFTKEI
jgi:hypothetical protein